MILLLIFSLFFQYNISTTYPLIIEAGEVNVTDQVLYFVREQRKECQTD